MLKDRKTAEAHFIAKEDMIFAGKEIINQGFKECFIISLKNDGTHFKAGEIIAEVSAQQR